MKTTYITPICDYIHLQGWYSLLKIVEQHERMALLKKYESQEPEKYDNVMASITEKKAICFNIIAKMNHINN